MLICSYRPRLPSHSVTACVGVSTFSFVFSNSKACSVGFEHGEQVTDLAIEEHIISLP